MTAPPLERQASPVPRKFGRYQLLDRVSRGGMSDIYLAKTVGIDGFQKPLIIKKLLPEYSKKPRHVRRFVNEAKTLAQLTHSNIVQIIDMGAMEDEYFIALEYIEGRNVAHLLSKARRRERPPSLEFCLHIVLELAKGLAYAHRKKGPHGEDLMLVHQDINSFNVMVSYDADVKIIDFGIARIFLEPSGWMGLPVAGKLLYFSPEQLKGQNIDHRVDIYGTGVLFYELLTGERLIQHQESISDTVKMILQTNVNERIRSNNRIPSMIKPVLEKSMARDPNDRYAWMEDMASHINLLVKNHGLELKHADFVSYMADLFQREITIDNRRVRRLLETEVPVETTTQPDTISNDLSFPDEVLSRLTDLMKEDASETGPSLPSVNIVQYGAGKTIFRQGDGNSDWYVIKAGKVRLFLRSGQAEQTIAMLGEGDFFGETSLIEHDERLLNAVAVEDTTCIAIGAEWFARLVPAGMQRNLILRLVERIRDGVWLLGAPLYQDPLCRFIYGLIFLYQRNLSRANREIELSELNEYVRTDEGPRAEKYLAKLQSLQVLEMAESKVRVKNIEKLEGILDLLAGEKKLTLKL